MVNGRQRNRKPRGNFNNMWDYNQMMRPMPPPLFRGRGFGPRGPPGFFGGPPAPIWGPPPPMRGMGPRGPFTGPRGVLKRHPNARGSKQWKGKSNNAPKKPTKRLSEDEIGVTEYMCDHDGFNGIIKSRYSDFQVNEIDLDGNVTKLTDKKIPEPPKCEEETEKYNVEILPAETWEKLDTLATATNPTPDVVEVDVTGMSKEQRTRIHDAVKKTFGEAIVSSTITTEDKKTVKFEKFKKGVRVDKRVKWVWPGEYVYFIVHKENCDTMEAAGRVAEKLGIPYVRASNLTYAGTKDRRAKTTQWFCIKRIEPRKVAHACKDMRELHVGNYKFSDTPLKLGMLKGNRFRIALRNVTAEDNVIEKACNNIKEHGFINYYGLQRFGTRIETPTYAIGLQLLLGNFQEAINQILEVRSGPLYFPLQHYKETGDAVASFKMLKRHLYKTHEGKLLRALSKTPKDLVGSLMKLPRNTRLLYIHSYQSLIWNQCVSERLRSFGLQPVVGDLVLAGTDTPCEEVEEEIHEEESEDEEPQNGEQKPEKSSQETKTEEAKPAEKAAEQKANGEKPRSKIPVKVLTQEDIDSGKYRLLDVVLPLPGYNIQYPPNMRHYYEELLTKDNITMDMKHKIKNYSMSGTYRHIAVLPENFEWQCVKYTDPLGDLILSDLDEMNNVTNTVVDPEGKYKALLLSFSLPSSCYATMALREILKVDTSGDNQAQQNNYFKEQTSTEGENSEESKKEGEENGDSETAKRKLDSEDTESDTDTKKTKTE